MKKHLLIIVLTLASLSVAAQGIDKPQYQIVTHRAGSYLGTFDIELFPLIAPLHVNNFDSLVSEQFYDSTAFHRVVPGFVIQGGDPNSISGPISTWGQGQPWQPTVPAEFNPVRHLRGILGAARDTDPNSANSQFYICVDDATFLDGNYTVYGRVTSGMDVVDTIVASPRDANDVPLQKIEMFVTYTGADNSVPGAPTLSFPLDSATNILNTQIFSWTIVPEAMMYNIELSTDPLFNTIDLTAISGINNVTVPGLVGSTVYYWRVKSNNGGHLSASSNVHSFTTTTGAADCIYPPDSSTNIPLSLIFEWSPVPNATFYTLQVSKNVNFLPLSLVYNTDSLTSTTQIVSGLDTNRIYYWRVRSANGAVQGFYSSKFSFRTGYSTSIPETASDFQILQLQPNPASEILHIELSSAKREPLHMELTDVTGKVFSEKTLKPEGDLLSVSFDVSGFARGMYFLTIRSATGSLTRQVLLQ